MTDQDALLEAAASISREIIASAVWWDDRCTWMGAMPEEGVAGRTTMSYRALGADLYGGTAGVGLFLAELAQVTGDGDSLRTASGALRHALSRVEDIPTSSVGLYGGPAGIALALALAARTLSQEDLDLAARKIAAELNAPDPTQELDLMSGSAGAIVGILALRALLAEERLLDLAVLHGDTLLAAAEQVDGGLCWPSRTLPGEPRLTGLSHGAAGIAVALLELAAVTSDGRYREAAEGAFAYERSLFDPVARNWPDLRGGQGDGRSTFAVFWCHGAPGGALARVRALELGADPALREEAKAGLSTTATWIDSALASGTVNYSLCHGLAGNAEILMEGHDLSQTQSALARRVAEEGIEHYGSGGRPWPSGAYGGATPSLFLGLAGIGRYYLRLARPELPSVLLLRPDQLPLR